MRGCKDRWEWLLRLAPLVVLLAGCPRHQIHANTGERVTIARGVKMSLQPASTLGRSVAASQIFTSSFRGKRRTMYFQVEVEPGRVTMVGMTPVGVRLFTLERRLGKISYLPQPFFKAALQPRHMLADFQLTYWPLKPLQTALAASGVKVRERRQGAHKERTFVLGARTIIAITYQHAQQPWRGKVEFQHRERGYRFTIDTKQLQALPPK